MFSSVQVGLRHECVMFLLLSNIHMDSIARRAMKEEIQEAWSDRGFD